jgi:hypothetical protein
MTTSYEAAVTARGFCTATVTTVTGERRRCRNPAHSDWLCQRHWTWTAYLTRPGPSRLGPSEEWAGNRIDR